MVNLIEKIDLQRLKGSFSNGLSQVTIGSNIFVTITSDKFVRIYRTPNTNNANGDSPAWGG